jgi:hypothetical protein
MSSIAGRTKPKRRYAIQRALAPHVDEEWAESFVVELRLLGVEGAHIGAALSEVESHCGESGQSAQVAFGTPVEYARSLQLPVNLEQSPQAVTRSLVPILVQVLGMYLLSWGFDAALRGPELEITAGRLLIPAVFLLGMVALARFAEPALRTVVYHPIIAGILAWLTFFALTAIGVVAFTSLDEAILQVPAGSGLAAGAAVLTGGVVWAIARRSASVSGGDPITSPFEQASSSTGDEAPTPTKLSANSRLATLTYTAMIPVGTVLLLAMTLTLHLLGAR